MPHAVLNHAFPADPSVTFYPSVAKQLRAAGVEVSIPAMPSPVGRRPAPDTWGPALASAVTAAPAETVLAGHSVGGWNIFRFLAARAADAEQFAGVTVVATPAYYIHYPDLVEFFAAPIDWDRVRAGAATFTVIQAADDQILAPDATGHGHRLRELLAARLLVLPAGGHFADFEGCAELPQLTQELLNQLRGS